MWLHVTFQVLYFVTLSGRNMSKRSMSFKHDDCQLCELSPNNVSIVSHCSTKVLSDTNHVALQSL